MSRRLLRLLRAVRQCSAEQVPQQQQQLQAAGLQLNGAACIHAADLPSTLLQRHLWAQQDPCQLQQRPDSGLLQPLLLQPHGQLQQQQGPLTAWPTRSQLQTTRAYAAADPARAIAETMAEVAQRKLADVQRQHEALQAKLEGELAGCGVDTVCHQWWSS